MQENPSPAAKAGRAVAAATDKEEKAKEPASKGDQQVALLRPEGQPCSPLRSSNLASKLFSAELEQPDTPAQKVHTATTVTLEGKSNNCQQHQARLVPPISVSSVKQCFGAMRRLPPSSEHAGVPGRDLRPH